ncbi:hypothetical protein [Thermosulfurimonas sp. F29]|uniref:hypothetical protein n=1 Tax=Thermosulfurimonas sp. F29 TaxID=2867247 RepID=UPI001C82910D|nr:hypothetical protein [Thermosulfurimonas sp. F29]MBX6421979.1 hypothetical protein [Thermosulfurimonas sp. F29]
MFKELVERVKGKGKWAGALALSAALLVPAGVQALGVSPPSLCNQKCSIVFDVKGDVDVNGQVMGVADLEGYFSLITARINIINDEMRVGGLVRALSKNDQFLEENEIENTRMTNTASVKGSVLRNAKGNIGLNVVAGDVNAQSNIASISAGKSERSMTQSTIFSFQRTIGNGLSNKGSVNTASLSDSVLKNAKGNIGVNVAAGVTNAQSNQLAVASAPAKVGVATAYVRQEGLNNWTENYPLEQERVVMYKVDLDLSARGNAYGTRFRGGYSGSEGGTFSGSGSIAGTSKGMSYQANNFYPDIWTGTSHTSGNQIGHVDLDNEAQGAIANPGRNGVGGIAFDNDNKIDADYEGGGSYSGKEKGTLSGILGAQKIALTGSVTGYIPVKIVRYKDSINTASLSGEVLMNAVGNIGVNIAAGTNNMQVNALSVTYVPNAGTEVPTPQPGGGTE